jgi:hypothetical protein
MVEHSSHHSSKVELFLSAKQLKDRDAFTKSDPYCVIFSESSPSHFTELSRTEVKKDDLNPVWSTSLVLDYHFELAVHLKFQVLDHDESKPDDLGSVLVSLGDLVAKGTSSLSLPSGGQLIVRVQQFNFSREAFVFHLRGLHLDKKDTFGKSDPFFLVYRHVHDNEWAEVYKSEYVPDTLDPVWKPFELREQVLCNSDRNRPIKFEVFDWDRNSDPELIGVHQTNLVQLLAPGYRFQLKHPKKDKPSGELEITQVVVKRYLTFIDYLWAGVHISLSVAIDFTASNKEPSDPHSLHRIANNFWNDYQQAIWEVGGILQAYDADHLYPVFGFGGCPRQGEPTSHCFPLTGNIANPYVHKVEGVLDVYSSALKVVELSGPTHFHHVINQTISVAKTTPPHSQYYILLILTDGAIMDMQETIDSIVTASHLPISIIIIGIGDAVFDSMVTLDADKKRLKDSHGKEAARDIVQFVSFKKFGGNAIRLTTEVLREVPHQLTEFMRIINYVPEAQTIIQKRDEVKVVVSQEEEAHHRHRHHHQDGTVTVTETHSKGEEHKVEAVVHIEGSSEHHHRHRHHHNDGTVTVTETHSKGEEHKAETVVEVEGSSEHHHRHRHHHRDGSVTVTESTTHEGSTEKKEGEVKEGEEYHHHRHHHHTHDS